MAKSKEEQDEADAADAEAAAAVAAAVEAANAAEDGDGQVIQKKKSLRMCRKCYFQEDVFKHSKYTQCESQKRRANIEAAIICAEKVLHSHRCVHAKLIRRIRRVCFRDSPKKCSHKETHMAKLWKKVNIIRIYILQPL